MRRTLSPTKYAILHVDTASVFYILITLVTPARRFPQLQRHLAHAVVDFIRSGAEPAETMVRSLVDCECDFINCDHPDFIGGRGAVRAVLQVRRTGGESKNVDLL